MHQPIRPSNAFSLVELSIVLVILGLLVGGVLSGRSLIRAAELRNITVEYQNWQTAINTFKGKYNAIPGDFLHATRFWNPASDCLTYSNAPVSTDKSTCNGNGSGDLAATLILENLFFWQHLSNAGLIEGSYDAYRGTDMSPNRSFPTSKLSGAHWDVRRLTGTDFFQTGDYFMLSSNLADWVGVTNSPILTPEEAWGADNKIDDGNPSSGAVMVPTGALQPNCTQRPNGANTTSTTTDAQYRLSNSGSTCMLFIAF